MSISFTPGVVAGQCGRTPAVFYPYLSNFDTIIELGFAFGGFSSFLYRNKMPATRLFCFDLTLDGLFGEGRIYNPQRKGRWEPIAFMTADIQKPRIVELIGHFIQHGERTLVLCDNGNKAKEFGLYAPLLKPDDVIMLHDYGDTQESFDVCATREDWRGAREVGYEDIAQVVAEQELMRYPGLGRVFEDVFWGAFSKVRS